MYERILIPTDGSDVAETPIEQALDLAERHSTEVYALYVVDTASLSLTLGGEQLDRIEQGRFAELEVVKTKAEEATDFVAARAAERGLEVVEQVAAGRPHEEIAEYAQEEGIDLVVMGSHGRSGVKRALLGSVTERVLRRIDVPVLVVDVNGN